MYLAKGHESDIEGFATHLREMRLKMRGGGQRMAQAVGREGTLHTSVETRGGNLREHTITGNSHQVAGRRLEIDPL